MLGYVFETALLITIAITLDSLVGEIYKCRVFVYNLYALYLAIYNHLLYGVPVTRYGLGLALAKERISKDDGDYCAPDPHKVESDIYYFRILLLCHFL